MAEQRGQESRAAPSGGQVYSVKNKNRKTENRLPPPSAKFRLIRIIEEMKIIEEMGLTRGGMSFKREISCSSRRRGVGRRNKRRNSKGRGNLKLGS